MTGLKGVGRYPSGWTIEQSVCFAKAIHNPSLLGANDLSIFMKSLTYPS